MDFEQYLKKSKFQRSAKCIMANFQKRKLKCIVILIKVDEMYNILTNLVATGYWPRDDSGIG